MTTPPNATPRRTGHPLRVLWSTAWGFGLTVFVLTGIVSWGCLQSRGATEDGPPPSGTPTPFDDEQPRYQDGAARLTRSEQQRIEAFSRAASSIVHVRASREGRLRPGSAADVEAIPELGAGFVWSRSGYVLTNAHLIEGHTTVDVVFADGTRLPAQFVGLDSTLDLAVLSIDSRGLDLTVLELGVSDNVRVGQDALAVGSPLGRNHTLTRGLVSALDRKVALPNGLVLEGAIQTDAPINPGNSGGPLLDSSGRVIGMVTALSRRSDQESVGNSGIGYAVPIDRIAARVPDLIQRGLRPYHDFGMYLCADQWNREMLDQAGIEGVIPLRVETDGTAAEAGIRPLQLTSSGPTYKVTHVIVGIHGTPTPDRATFDRVLFEARDNASVLLDVQRVDLDYLLEQAPSGVLVRTLEPPFHVGDVEQVEVRRR